MSDDDDVFEIRDCDGRLIARVAGGPVDLAGLRWEGEPVQVERDPKGARRLVEDRPPNPSADEGGSWAGVGVTLALLVAALAFAWLLVEFVVREALR